MSITIPAELVSQVHEAMLYQLGLAADRIGVETDRVARVRDLEGAFASFDGRRAIVEAAQAALDAGAPLELDARHREDLAAALREDIALCGDVVRSAAAEGDVPAAQSSAKQWAAGARLLRSLAEPVSA